MVQDQDKNQQLIIMNEQCAGASAYNNGTLQIMINRLGSTIDSLGNPESMAEYQNG